MKEVIEKEEVAIDVMDAPSSYQSGEEATTNLASLLKILSYKRYPKLYSYKN